MTWWRDPVCGSRYTQRQRDQIVLWWMTYLWLNAHGHLQMTEAAKEPLRLVPSPDATPQTLRTIMRNAIREALIRHQGVQAAAAEELGVSKRVMHYQVGIHGLREYALYRRVNGRIIVPDRRTA